MNRSNILSRVEGSASTTVAGPDASGIVLESYACLAGESAAICAVRSQLQRVSAHFRVALITGEPGTGKEIVARMLHDMSAKPEEQFLARSAASFLSLMPQILTQTPLLGHVGAEMGGNRGLTHEELLCAGSAGRCTLFLGDVSALTHGEQVYLLETLRRLAATRSAVERPRLIFASERDLRSLTVARQFDPGLYRKISALEILLPPLRSRPEDIERIVSQLPVSGREEREAEAYQLDSRALSRLQQYSWPGNVRELERVLELARLHAGGGMIEAMHLPSLGAALRAAPVSTAIVAPTDRLEDVALNHVLEVLMRCSGNKVRAAERLGISRSTLYRMLEHGAGSVALDRFSQAS